MDAIKSGIRRGAIFGVGLVILLALGTGFKLLGGASVEVVEWTGVVGLVLGFPLSLVSASLTGVPAYVILVLAIVLNWALVGLLIGAIVSAVTRHQDRAT